MILDILKDVDGIYKLYRDPTLKQFVTIDDKFSPRDHYQTWSFISLEKVSGCPAIPLYIPRGTEVKLNVVDRCPPKVERVADPITEEDLKKYAPAEYKKLAESGEVKDLVKQVQTETVQQVTSDIHVAIEKKREENLVRVQSELLKMIKSLYTLKNKTQQAKYKDNIKFFCHGIIFMRPELTAPINQFIGEMLQ